MRIGVAVMVVGMTAACTPGSVEPARPAPLEEVPLEEVVELVPAPPVDGVPPQFFQAEEPTQDLRPDAASVLLQGPLLQFRGVVSVGQPCVVLQAGVTTGAGELTLTLQAVQKTNPCVAAVGSVAYKASVEAPAPGDVRVRVVHTHPGTGVATTTVLDTTVAVP